MVEGTIQIHNIQIQIFNKLSILESNINIELKQLKRLYS